MTIFANITVTVSLRIVYNFPCHIASGIINILFIKTSVLWLDSEFIPLSLSFHFMDSITHLVKFH